MFCIAPLFCSLCSASCPRDDAPGKYASPVFLFVSHPLRPNHLAVSLSFDFWEPVC